MEITEVRIRLLKKDDTKLKAVATVTIGDYLVVHDIKIIQGDNDYFIAMPSKKMPTGEYKDIVHPLNTQTREKLKSIIVEEYHKAVAAAQE